jgi:hypothetical protein
MSHRTEDFNGWVEIKDNPISKVGVFPYLGAQISPALIPDKIYNVYRPEEELAHPDCIESFKLLPWTDEHAMLGTTADGLLPAEEKGVHGVIGEDVYFADGYLKAKLKIFSEKLASLIEQGKKELSIGYRCIYDLVSGSYMGVQYDAIQREIRGNHLALVEEGRAGPDVAVLDSFTFTFDTKDLKMPQVKSKGLDEDLVEQEKAEALTLESLAAKVDSITESVAKLAEMVASKSTDEDTPPDEMTEPMDEDESKPDDEKKEVADEDEEKKDDTKLSAMDAQIKRLSTELRTLKKHAIKSVMSEVSQRNALAQRLSHHVGVFDHADKTVQEVAEYGVKKLGLTVSKEHAVAAIEGFLAGKQAALPFSTPIYGMDTRGDRRPSEVDEYFS